MAQFHFALENPHLSFSLLLQMISMQWKLEGMGFVHFVTQIWLAKMLPVVAHFLAKNEYNIQKQLFTVIGLVSISFHVFLRNPNSR